ncbi:MAG: energy-coupling factor transporter ATPase [Clostridia bacterium]|nr:energy-coupling factor transporter ATPase [Clostridia bacterium]
MAIAELKNVDFVYGRGTPYEIHALKGINLEIRENTITGIIGHTGSGKSTLVQLLNGLLKPTSGEVLVEGVNIWENPKKIASVRFKVGLVMQHPEHQLFEETVEKDIAFGPRNMGLSEEEITERVHRAARFTGLSEETLKKSPFDLSGGQKRRVALAGVIAMEPKLLVLDEPAAGLDPRGRREILTGIREYQRSTGNSVLIISHSMEDMAIYCDRVIVFSDGEQIMDGTCAEVFSRYDELYAVGLDVPEITKVAAALIDEGIGIGRDVYTVNWAVTHMMDRLRGEGSGDES